MRARTFPSVTTLVTTLALVACGGDGTNQLVETADLEPGEACPYGGIVLHIGDDDDGDGALAAGEIVESHEICAGRPGDDGYATLATSTQLDRGDEDCPNGGVEISVGLDNGDNGGTASNGTLEAGEIDQTLTVCDGEPAYNLELLDIPTNTPTQPYTIDVSGGAGSTSAGGDGGRVLLGAGGGEFASTNPIPNQLGVDGGGLPGGHVKLFRTGDTDAAFSPPSLNTNFGANPLVISSNRTVVVRADNDFNEIPDSVAGLSIGDPYLLQSTTSLYIWDGVGGATARATGLHVQTGARVTLGDGTQTSLELNFTGNVRNEGVIATPRSQLYVYSSGFSQSSSGQIDLTSSAIPTLYISGQYGVVNAGILRANGVDGNPAGSVELRAEFGPVLNTGTVQANGHGTASSGASAGGFIRLRSSFGVLVNTGTIEALGSSDTDFGGQGGRISLYAEQATLYNTGTIDASGGTARLGCATCGGGWATSFDANNEAGVLLWVEGGGIHSNGTITADGGGGRSGDGGEGGTIAFVTESEDFGSAGSILVSGDLSAAGGAGNSGGDGGEVLAHVATRSSDHAQIIFTGYSSVASRGGDGAYGGWGGEVSVANGCPSVLGSPVGGAINTTDIDVRGGQGTSFDGGYGGGFGATTCLEDGYTTLGGGAVMQTGTVSASAGTGVTGGGYGGRMFVFGRDWAENTGDVTVNGGSGSFANAAGVVYVICATCPSNNSGAITGIGGNATGTGAEGGEGALVYLIGAPSTNSADIVLTGGDGSTSTLGGKGGTGLQSSAQADSVNTGTWAVDPGPGGIPGVVIVDGVDRTSDWFTP